MYSTPTLQDAYPHRMYDDSISSIDFCATRCFPLLHFATGSRSFPTRHPYNALGFAQYMQSCNLENFTADEIIKPRYPDRLDADEAFNDPISGPVLLPARWLWPRLVAPLAVLQMARRSVGPITVRYAYRPPKYNKRCGSTATMSDHIFACAVDVSFDTRADLLKALRRTIMPRWRLPEFGMSLGYNRKQGSKLHLGIWAPETERKGHSRIWYYDK